MGYVNPRHCDVRGHCQELTPL